MSKGGEKMPIIIVTVLGFVLSLLLVSVESFVQKNPQKNEYLDLLPGYNCGSCGYGGCEKMSEAMLEDVMNYKKCRPLKGEALERMEEYLRKNHKI